MSTREEEIGRKAIMALNRYLQRLEKGGSLLFEHSVSRSLSEAIFSSVLAPEDLKEIKPVIKDAISKVDVPEIVRGAIRSGMSKRIETLTRIVLKEYEPILIDAIGKFVKKRLEELSKSLEG